MWGSNNNGQLGLPLSVSVQQNPTTNTALPHADVLLTAAAFGTSLFLSVAANSPCAPGTFSSSGFYPCTLCPNNTYQQSMQSLECLACPVSTSAPSGSVNATQCRCMISQQDCRSDARSDCVFHSVGSEPNIFLSDPNSWNR